MSEHPKYDKDSVNILPIMADVQLRMEEQEISLAVLIASQINICDGNGNMLSGKEKFDQARLAAKIIVIHQNNYPIF